jgi:hypothetical protein
MSIPAPFQQNISEMRYKLTHSFWMNITLADLSFPEELSILSRMATCEDYREKATIVMMNQSRFFQAGSIMSGITVTFGNQRSY